MCRLVHKVRHGSFELQVRGLTVALGLSAVPTDKDPPPVISDRIVELSALL